MHRIAVYVSFAVITVIVGCQSHEAKVADLQKQYDDINAQFAKDCSAEMLNLPHKLSAKCSDESKKLKDITERLQAERAKQ